VRIKHDRGLFATAGLLLATVLGGCSVPAAPSRESAALSDALSGGILRLAHESPAGLDPVVVESVYESLPVNQIFDGLVDLDPSLSVVPALASTWTLSRDGRTYTFHLRAGVRFHDGTRLTADDVVFTIRRVLAPGRERRSVAFSYLSGILGASDYAAGRREDLPGVRAVNPSTVEIELTRPYLSFLEVLAMDGVRIVPRHVVEARGDDGFARAPVGTGPFRLAAWDDSQLRLEANPDYFGGPPRLDGITVNFLRDDEIDLGAERFDRGQLDVLEASEEHLERLGQNPEVRIYRYQELSLSFLGLLTGAPPLNDVRIRQAHAGALDRDALASQSAAKRRRAAGILPPGMPAYSPRTKGLGFDPERSRRLLEEAGYPGGRGLKPVNLVTTARSAATEQVLAQLRSDLARVGIPLRIDNVSWPELSRRIEDHAAPAFLLAWIADLPDPDAFLRTLFEADGAANYFDFHDRETWELLERGAGEMNPVRRAEIYRSIEQRILELSPLVPLYHTVGIVAMRPTVRGLEPGPLGLASVNFERVWFARPGSEP
jgi:peptide/nickel transport system substrate-binding protein/oligopeptide transport system substrate-binding protein